MSSSQEKEQSKKLNSQQHNLPKEMNQLTNVFNTVWLLNVPQMETEPFEHSPKQNQSPNAQQYLPNDWVDKLDSVSPAWAMIKGYRKISDIEFLPVNDEKSSKSLDDDEDEEIVWNLYEDRDNDKLQYTPGSGKGGNWHNNEGNFKKSTLDSENNNTQSPYAWKIDSNVGGMSKTPVVRPIVNNVNCSKINTTQGSSMSSNWMGFYNNTNTPIASSNLSLNKHPPPLSLSNSSGNSNCYNSNMQEHLSNLDFMQQYCGINQGNQVSVNANNNVYNNMNSFIRKGSAPWMPNWIVPNQDIWNPCNKNMNYHNIMPKSKKKSKESEEYILEMFGRRGWICEQCNNFNYESRNKCNRCSIPKKPKKISQLSQELLATSMESMMNAKTEYPNSCGSMNNTSSPNQFQWNPNQNNINNNNANNNNTNPSSMNPPKMALNIDKQYKGNEHKGDWCCSKCHNINFSFRFVCNRCQLSKEDSFNSYIWAQGKI